MLKVIRRSLVLLLIIIVGLALAFRAWNARSLPQISGELRVPGLQHPVDILRDAYGIPHIYAQTDADMMFALGYVHAQDRLYQMEIQRRTAAGQIADFWGPEALGIDRFIRTLGLAQQAQRTWDAPQTLDARTRADLRAYTAGVNAYLGEDRALPPEFMIASLTSGGGRLRGPWQETDSIAWLKVMALDLGANFRRELSRLYLATRLSSSEITDFYTPYPGSKRFELPDLRALYGLAAAQASTASNALAPLMEGEMPIPAATLGSNNWVMDGRLMESGASVLANDPHLGLGVPGIWYFAHISSEESGTSAIGATLPGVPAIVIGRNDHIAWGFTNTAPDVQDLFVERINPHTNRYQTPTGWQPLEIRTETIDVAGGQPVEMQVRRTRHGPLMSDIIGVPQVFGNDASFDYGFALQWPTIMDGVPDTTMNAATQIFRAQSYEEFVDIAADYVAPQQNMVILENAGGRIGYIAPGKVPIRGAENPIQGWAPPPAGMPHTIGQALFPMRSCRRFWPRKTAISSQQMKIFARLDTPIISRAIDRCPCAGIASAI